MAIRQRLAEENPNVAAYRRELTRSLNSIGEALIFSGRATEAIDVYSRSRDILEAREGQPFGPGIPEWSGMQPLGPWPGPSDRGDRAAATMNLRRSVLLWDRQAAVSPESRYHLARSHALLASLAGETGSGVSPPEGRDEADRAITELKRAVTDGYRDPKMDTETDFDSLRTRPDFRILMLDLTFPANPFAR